MRNVTTTLVLLSLVSLLPAQTKAPQTIEELRTEIEKALKRTGTPGAAVVIVRDGKVEWAAGLGIADVATKKPLTAKTPMRLGSVSKEFVALAALKLQEEGKLKLTDTLRQWLPECPIENPWEQTDPIRLEQLLEHTAGVPDMGWREYAHSDPKPVTMAEALAFAPENRRVRWRPGTRTSYSNYGAQLAAAIVEKAAGRRFEDYVQEELFAPLGMTSARYFPLPEKEPPVSRTYRPDGRMVPYSHLVYRAAGAISASAEDMANYVRFHLERGSLDGHRILSPESMDRLEVPGTLPAVKAGVTTGQGLFNAAASVRGYEMHGHRGEVDGAVALFGYVPELGIGRVIMINASNLWTMGWIRGLVDGYISRGSKEVAFPPAAKLPAEMMRELPGYYMNLATRGEGFMGLGEHNFSLRKVTADPEGMTWRAVLPGGPAERWVAMGDKVFRRPEGTKPALAVVSGDAGGLWLQNDYGTWQKVPALRVWLSLWGTVAALALLASSALFALVWGPRRLLGRLPGAGPLAVRASPLLGLAGVLAFVGCHRMAMAAGYATMGACNAWTAGMFLASLLLPVGAGLSVLAVWRHRHAAMNRAAYWHSVAVAFSVVWLTGFCLHWGIIGVRTWA